MHNGENFSARRSRVPLVCAHLPLISLYPLLPLLSTRVPWIFRRPSLPLLLLINLHQPIVLPLLIFTTITPAWHPLALLLIIYHISFLLLRVDAFLRCKLLPFRWWFLYRHRLLPWERCGG